MKQIKNKTTSSRSNRQRKAFCGIDVLPKADQGLKSKLLKYICERAHLVKF